MLITYILHTFCAAGEDFLDLVGELLLIPTLSNIYPYNFMHVVAQYSKFSTTKFKNKTTSCWATREHYHDSSDRSKYIHILHLWGKWLVVVTDTVICTMYAIKSEFWEMYVIGHCTLWLADARPKWDAERRITYGRPYRHKGRVLGSESTFTSLLGS